MEVIQKKQPSDSILNKIDKLINKSVDKIEEKIIQGTAKVKLSPIGKAVGKVFTESAAGKTVGKFFADNPVGKRIAKVGSFITQPKTLAVIATSLAVVGTAATLAAAGPVGAAIGMAGLAVAGATAIRKTYNYYKPKIISEQQKITSEQKKVISQQQSQDKSIVQDKAQDIAPKQPSQGVDAAKDKAQDIAPKQPQKSFFTDNAIGKGIAKIGHVISRPGVLGAIGVGLAATALVAGGPVAWGVAGVAAASTSLGLMVHNSRTARKLNTEHSLLAEYNHFKEKQNQVLKDNPGLENKLEKKLEKHPQESKGVERKRYVEGQKGPSKFKVFLKSISTGLLHIHKGGLHKNLANIKIGAGDEGNLLSNSSSAQKIFGMKRAIDDLKDKITVNYKNTDELGKYVIEKKAEFNALKNLKEKYGSNNLSDDNIKEFDKLKNNEIKKIIETEKTGYTAKEVEGKMKIERKGNVVVNFAKDLLHDLGVNFRSSKHQERGDILKLDGFKAPVEDKKHEQQNSVSMSVARKRAQTVGLSDLIKDEVKKIVKETNVGEVLSKSNIVSRADNVKIERSNSEHPKDIQRR